MILYLETEKFAKSVQIVLVSLQLILNRFSRVVDFEQILRDMFLLFLYYFISLLLFLSPLLKRKEISKFLSRIYLQLFGCYVLVLLKILQFQAYRCTSFKVLRIFQFYPPPFSPNRIKLVRVQKLNQKNESTAQRTTDILKYGTPRERGYSSLTDRPLTCNILTRCYQVSFLVQNSVLTRNL